MMAKEYYYEILIQSDLGNKLTRFLEQCQRCNLESHKYCKKMGGQYFYPDGNYLEGGVSYISFHENKPSDPAMWREVCTEYTDGTVAFTDGRLIKADGTTSRLEGDYKGPLTKDDVVYFEPNVHKRMDLVEVPTKDYRPKDTFDSIYAKSAPVEKTDADGNPHYYIQCLRFIYNEPPGHSGGRVSGKQIRTASRSVRRAIKAEVQRTKLPVMPYTRLLELIEADLPERSVRLSLLPCIFPLDDYYYVSSQFQSLSEDVKELTPQQFRTKSDKWRLAQKKKPN